MKKVLLVRHAEREDGQSRMDVSVDPSLSSVGRARAEMIAELLGESEISAIFTTEYRRTQETAGPLARVLKLTPVVVPASRTGTLVAKIKRWPGDTALVVGHMDTVPWIIRSLGGPAVQIAAGEYDSLFSLDLRARRLVRTRHWSRRE